MKFFNASSLTHSFGWGILVSNLKDKDMNREGLKKLNGTTVTINTLLMPLIDVGGYESVIGPLNLEDNFIEGLDLDTDYYSSSWNWIPIYNFQHGYLGQLFGTKCS